MSDTYSIGEVAIYFRPDSPRHLMEVTIDSSLFTAPARDHVTGVLDPACTGYRVKEVFTGGCWRIEPMFLRKKPPKSKHTGIPTAVLALFDPTVALVSIGRLKV